MSDLHAIIDDDIRRDNALMNARKRVRELVAENRALRETLIEQARAINVLEMSASASSRSCNVADVGLEGAGAGVTEAQQ